MKHTKEKWRVETFSREGENGFAILDPHGKVIAWLFTASTNAFGRMVPSELPTKENAARIVDCVNACEGLNPIQLRRAFDLLRTLMMRGAVDDIGLRAEMLDAIELTRGSDGRVPV